MPKENIDTGMEAKLYLTTYNRSSRFKEHFKIIFGWITQNLVKII